MAQAPQWAIDLVQQIAIEQELHKPELVWRRAGKSRSGYGFKRENENAEWVRFDYDGRRRKGASGNAALDGKRIVVTAGTERADQRIVLLHEMAHVATPGDWHSRRFWETAWRYFGLYAPNIPARRLLQREGSYKTTALVVAVELGIHGAKAALARERAKPKPGRFVHYS